MASIVLEKKNHVYLLTINRPEALNALNSSVLSELEQAVAAVADDKDARVLVITGAGKAFVAGADIAEMRDMQPDEALAFARLGNRVFTAIEELPIPVIAAVNGFALGGGCELALACTLRYASEKAKFGQPEVGLGITPGFGGTQRLPRTVGTANAMEMILTGNTVNAETALSIGLVNRVFPHDELLGEVMKVAETIANNAPVAVSHAKNAIMRFSGSHIHEDLDYEAHSFSECFKTDDQTMAMTAFLEKRPHDEFQGK